MRTTTARDETDFCVSDFAGDVFDGFEQETAFIICPVTAWLQGILERCPVLCCG